MPKILLPKDVMLEVLDSGVDVVSDETVGNSRWSIQHKLIFKREGKLYSCSYQVGATEQQDESPWEYQPEVQCTEVEPYEKTIVAYREVA